MAAVHTRHNTLFFIEKVFFHSKKCLKSVFGPHLRPNGGFIWYPFRRGKKGFCAQAQGVLKGFRFGGWRRAGSVVPVVDIGHWWGVRIGFAGGCH